MGAERRLERRQESSTKMCPISCYLRIGTERIDLTIINYHHRGACLKLPSDVSQISEANATIVFRIGEQEISEKIKSRVVWETISQNGMFGVEFSVESSFVLSRAERFASHGIVAPIISSPDPLDPNRIIYFKAHNVSTTGMLLGTSFSNKHIFPGMELRNATIDIPNIGKTVADLFVENSRPSQDGKSILYGVSVKGDGNNVKELTSIYLSNLGMVDESSSRIEKLYASGLMQKKLKLHLTIREILSEKDYESVLRLRYQGYKAAGKVESERDWRTMGEGLQNEGTVLGAFLGGEIVASVELRFSEKSRLRLADKLDLSIHPDTRGRSFVEINKLVIHRLAQKTDLVVGLFQKIHALAMINGKPDGLLVADDELVFLYRRLGARQTSISFPHPVKTGVLLHVMIIDRTTYEDGIGINPLAWTQIYETTHSYLSELGLAEEKKFSLFDRVVIKVTKFYLRHFAKNRGKINEKQKVVDATQEKRGPQSTALDPRWTRQHLNASVLLPYLLVADEQVGAMKVDAILNSYGFERTYFRSVANWISVDFFDEFIDQYKKIGNLNELQRLAGYRNLSRDVLGVNHFLLKHFLSPKDAFRAFGTYLPKFNKTRTYQILDSGTTFCHIRLGLVDPSLRPRDESARHNWLAILDGHVLVTTGKHAKIKQHKSIFDGDQFCEYLIQWDNPLFSVRNALLSVATMAVAAKSVFLFSDLFPSSSRYLIITLVTLLLLSAIVVWKYYGVRHRYKGVIDSLDEFQRDSDERYRELQLSKSILEKGYQEGKILENISREIQTSDDLEKILDSSLKAVVGRLEFKRAFIMLADSEGKFLRTSALEAGGSDSSAELWDFKVDISRKRENPLVVSSVFHSGQSILITDIETHKFHLNEVSRKLVERLDTKGFSIVPIPSEKSNWGVLIADKAQDAEGISRRELVALQRVCQSLGLALDKKAKIDSEIRIRKIFQKYVPSSVVEQTLGLHEPTLGGESKEIICLFLDIRNFTALSNRVSAQILVGLLNQMFDLLQGVVGERNGVIDKFLGDGALVTWGAIPGSILSAHSAIDASLRFLERLEDLNVGLERKGLDKINVGIGIHRGPAISGNIGSQERMEYTVIGPTVNIASRLEQLNKFFDCNIVISESVVDFSSLPVGWRLHDGVVVRGVDHPMKVATFSKEKKAL